MTNMTATRLFNEALERREKLGVEQALSFVQEHGDPNDARQMNLLYALTAAAGRADEAFALLSEAVTEKGFWYPAEYLLEDEDLESLRGREGFAELADLCGKREEAALANAAPGLTVLEQSKDASGVAAGQPETATSVRPTLLVLHGDQENERDTEAFWKSAQELGWNVGLIRSSQIRFSDAYGWDDIDLGAAELREHLETLRGIAGEEAFIVLGAFSTGAEVALNAVLHDEFPADGLIFVSSWLDDAAEWAEALDRLEERKPRSLWIAGAEDDEGRESSRVLTQALQERGRKARLKVVEDLGHDYPDDFSIRLAEGLNWIAQDSGK
ncbi:alpha/beta hydrolase [Saccharibacillus sacchari]|uniref:alpha/beta hydrolase n=1 Tax=Saccharibacillus sacchari TaxID=456493 RepID=UPI0004ADBF04|nr:alpha/beta hydrolase [Saccharibacillus sacchari]